MCGSHGVLLTSLVFLTLSALTIASNSDNISINGLKVCLRDGCVQGKSEEGNVRSYYAWYGIPFATPPLGPLRALFHHQYGKVCGMPPTQIVSRNKRLTVLVFIHGGSFKVGSADPAIYGPDYFMDTKQVIVVTIQYRLGVFGFLAADHESCKGNYGLKDQNMALRWVRENIRSFGGDHRRVTLMGQSAGAASVQYQMISKRSNGLFQRGIMASGSALAFWALKKDPETQFRQYATLAGIPNVDTLSPQDIVELLRKKSALELLEYQILMPAMHTTIALFRPVVERKWPGAFLTQDPEYIWANGRFEQRPFLTGVTGYEEGVFGDLYYNEAISQAVMADWDVGISTALDIPPSALGPIRDYYFEGEPSEENSHNLLRLRDRFLDYPMYEKVHYYTQYADLRENPVHLYHFNFSSPFSTSFITNPYNIQERGASHSDDLLYLFRHKMFDGVFARDVPETQMKDFYVRFIVDYVKYGFSPMYTASRCRRVHMNRGFCDYLDIQRDYSTTPHMVKVSVSNRFELGMVTANKEVDRLIAMAEV